MLKSSGFAARLSLSAEVTSEPIEAVKVGLVDCWKFAG